MAAFNSVKTYFGNVHNKNKEKATKFILALPVWIILIAIALLVTGFVRNSKINNRADNDMAAYWSQGSNTSYRHMVAFARGTRADGIEAPPIYIDQDVSIRKADISNIRTSLQSVVDSGRQDKKDGGLDSDGSPRFWEDCYSCDYNDTVTMIDENSSANMPSVQANIVAVGGNYKVFHPFIYMSGGFLPEACIDMNQVVINDELAWRFFRSYDVIGNKISLLDQTFTISGVVREGNSSLDTTAKVREPRCYIYFSALENFYLDSAEDGPEREIAITCYEAMLPELVSGVAVNDFKNALPTYTEMNPQLYVVSYTGRLGLINVWNYMMPIGATAESLSQYTFPYWEKVAQLKIQNVFFNLIIIVLGFVLLFIGVVMLILRLRKVAAGEKN